MVIYDLAIRVGEKDGETVVFMDQAMIDRAHETYDDQSIVLSPEQIVLAIRGLQEALKNVEVK